MNLRHLRLARITADSALPRQALHRHLLRPHRPRPSAPTLARTVRWKRLFLRGIRFLSVLRIREPGLATEQRERGSRTPSALWNLPNGFPIFLMSFVQEAPSKRWQEDYKAFRPALEAPLRGEDPLHLQGFEGNLHNFVYPEPGTCTRYFRILMHKSSHG